MHDSYQVSVGSVMHLVITAIFYSAMRLIHKKQALNPMFLTLINAGSKVPYFQRNKCKLSNMVLFGERGGRSLIPLPLPSLNPHFTFKLFKHDVLYLLPSLSVMLWLMTCLPRMFLNRPFVQLL